MPLITEETIETRNIKLFPKNESAKSFSIRGQSQVDTAQRMHIPICFFCFFFHELHQSIAIAIMEIDYPLFT